MDVCFKIDMMCDYLVGKEMDVGCWYLCCNFYFVVINCFCNVIVEYEIMLYMLEVFYCLVEVYVVLGIDEEVCQVVFVLGYNFLGSEWYEVSYNLLMCEGIVFDNVVVQDDLSYFQCVWCWLFG